jgi:hypothetical protein
MVAAENSSATSTALTIERMAKFRSPIDRICCCAFSLTDAVLVSLDELANARSSHDEASLTDLTIRYRAHDVEHPGSRPIALEDLRHEG